MDGKVKKRLGLTHSLLAKTMAFILCILMLCMTALSVVGISMMFYGKIYTTSEADICKSEFDSLATNCCYRILSYITDYKEYDAYIDRYLGDQAISYAKVEDLGNDFEVYEFTKSESQLYIVHYGMLKYTDDSDDISSVWLGSIKPDDKLIGEYDNIFTITIGIPADIPMESNLYWMIFLIHLLYVLRFWIYAIGLGSLIIAILCFAFLMRSAGRKRGIEGVCGSILTKIPFEIPTAVVGLVSVAGYAIISDHLYYNLIYNNDIVAWVAYVVWSIITVIMLIFWFMSLALRIKLGTLLKNTIVFYTLRFIWRVLRFCGRCIRAVIRAIPMIWKTIVFLGAVVIIQYILIIGNWGELDNLLVCWLLGNIIATFFIIYFVLMLIRLKKGAREIAEGKLDYKVDTKYLILDLKDHGDDLNRIRSGLNLAVEERLKSERMKTELITNVSHDIKTPLTSIINYSDLICREECENENIREYASVLHNQSERMKRLLDDLVEASKASSGNLDIILEECDASVIISQLAGEYSQSLSDAGLELICSYPEEKVKIMADGRRLWRVFDNLMNNARKYALRGTRVYVSLEVIGQRAVFRFKNISSEPLPINADELSERFVRGDASRGTEGNGLGLSIAKSLTELQDGTFAIVVDGDLFKVTVSFPMIM